MDKKEMIVILEDDVRLPHTSTILEKGERIKIHSLKEDRYSQQQMDQVPSDFGPGEMRMKIMYGSMESSNMTSETKWLSVNRDTVNAFIEKFGHLR